MKTFSVFDIIGPRMVGPSSSHTAGAVRIGLVAHNLITGHSAPHTEKTVLEPFRNTPEHSETKYSVPKTSVSERSLSEHSELGRIASAEITLYGSFAETGRGHGTDRAIIAGILGVEPDDARVKYSMLLAKSENVSITINYSEEEMPHPNTARVQIRGTDGREFEILGASIGGGNIEIIEINGMEVSFSGDYPTLIAFYRDEPGVISLVTGMLSEEDVNVAFMKVFRSAKRQGACMVIETDAPVPNELLLKIRDSVESLEDICSI